MDQPYFITALCTPLTENEDLHHEGLEAHIEDQLANDIDGLLVGGTMGAMQLLKDSTYLDLVNRSVEINAGRSEILVGIGDTSFARTRERLEQVDSLPINGVVLLTPYCIKFKQPELIHYFQSIADISKKPVYLYDLPQMTGSKVEIDTVVTLSKHPNIHGIKCSDQLVTARPLLEIASEAFRVILAQPLLMDLLLRSGINEHLDGIYGVVPHWMSRMKRAAIQGQWDEVESVQRDLAELLKALIEFPAPLFASAAELLKLRGVQGTCAPAPIRSLTPEQKEAFLALPICRKAAQTQSATLEAVN